MSWSTPWQYKCKYYVVYTFDDQVVSANIIRKIEANDGSYAQLTLADYASGPIADGQWQTIVIPRDELIAQGLNVENINLFLVFPEWDKATGAVLELDNIVVE